MLACARTRLDVEWTNRIQTLAADNIDWSWLLRAAARHRTSPLLYRSLSAACGSMVPEDTMRVLRAHFKANAHRNLLLTKHLIQALRALESAGVRALPFKGPALAEFAYGDLSLRQFSDLDILVRRRDVSRATETLIAAGYRLSLEADVPQATYLQSMHHYTFVRDDVEAALELHWRITERYFDPSRASERIWNRVETATLAGASVLRMADEDLLLWLCIHGAKHGWECLAQICDISELLQARTAHMDWSTALTTASAPGFRRALLLGVSLANTLLETPLSPEISRDILSDSTVQALASRIQAALFQQHASPAPAGESERFRLFRLHLGMRDRLRDKIFHCLRVAFVPSQEDWVFISLPSRLSFLHYFLRPLRLLAKYMRKALTQPKR